MCVYYYSYSDYMKRRELVDILKDKYIDNVVMIKYGNFYRVFYPDSIIIWGITNYKIVDDDRIGFPISSIEKIKNRLNILNINYVIYDSEIANNNICFDNNKYKEYLDKYLEMYSKKIRVDKVIDKFKNVIENDEEKLKYYEERIQ